MSIFLILPLTGAIIAGIFIFREVRFNYYTRLIKNCQERKVCDGRILALENLVKAGRKLERINLKGAKLGLVQLSGVFLEGAQLEAAFMEGANLHRANLHRANLYRANLIAADLRSANLKGADLEGADLKSANLKSVDLEGADLKNANLKSANLKSANLGGASFFKANLKNVFLEDAQLEASFFGGADLSRANLKNADLKSANLEGANLTGAILRSAILQSADLNRADLKGADFRSQPRTGVGLTVMKFSQNLSITRVYENSPADRENINRGDIIIQINGQNTKELDLDEADKLLFSPSGTTVTLTIQPALETLETKDYTLKSTKFLASTIGLTTIQVKTAKNWEYAKYDPHFHKELGLPSELPKDTKN